MFGGFGVGKYMAMREQAKTAPHRQVTRKQFIAALVKTGVSKKEAEMQAKISTAFGSTECLIGGEMLSIKPAKPKKTKAKKDESGAD